MEHSLSMCFHTRRRQSSDRGETVVRAKSAALDERCNAGS
jgi:hypothetical protein